MTLKEKLLHHCLGLINGKIEVLQHAIREFQDAANEDSKSSMGDKYETNRAMMHLEKEKAASQLNQLLKMKQVLDNIKIGKKGSRVEIGSVIETEKGKYFISIGLGPLEFEGEKYFVISAASPIGQEMMGKQTGNTFSFGGVNQRILTIQ
ncbi:MAG: GreA/GreB family elongation factor [Bacteroidota bacterium]